MKRICCYCKKSLGHKPPYKGKDFDGTPWIEVESHGICDPCMKRHFPEVIEERKAMMERRKRRLKIVSTKLGRTTWMPRTARRH